MNEGVPMPGAGGGAGDGRAETDAEPRYRELLERERATWWNSGNFEKWKNHYIDEHGRGRYIIETLRKFVPDFDPFGVRVLDIGCGDGGVPIAFAESGARAMGIEPNAASLERARVRAEDHEVEVVLHGGVAESLPFEAESFDVVILDNVLEHVSEREAALAEIHRVLGPAGLLYVVTPKPFTPQSVWSDPHYELAGLVLLPRRLQVWYFERVRGGGEGAYAVGLIPTRRRLRKLLEAAGFRPVASPRELWVNYVRDRLSRPTEVRAGAKRRLAVWLRRRSWPFTNPLARWALDVAIGSNFFIARRIP